MARRSELQHGPAPKSTASPRTSPKRRFIVSLIVLASIASSVAPAAAASGDLNGDGRDELVVGIPDENIGSARAAGEVQLLRGSRRGLSGARSVGLTQRSFGGTAEAFDRFGAAIAYGDFDGDGKDDVALGAPAEDYRGVRDVGVVHVVYGAQRPSLWRGDDLLSQAGSLAGKPGNGDFFGAALAVGRFNGDRFDDLVVGLPGKDQGKGRRVAAGAVVVIYGGPRGLTRSGSRLLSQAGKVRGVPEDYDAFGVSVTTGDINADGFDDVAVGSPGESVAGMASAGVVHVFFGAAKGLRRVGNVQFGQGAAGGTVEAGDAFGRSLAMGDFDNDGFADLIVGAPGEDDDAGAIAVFAGSAQGLAAGRTLMPGVGGVPGVSSPGAEWSRALAVGDFNGDNDDDLVVGAPFADPGGVADAGELTVLGGDAAGLSGTGGFLVSQREVVKSTLGAGDQFGWSLRSGDFNGDGIADLAASARGEDRRGLDTGLVHVLDGTTQSLDPSTAATIWQGSKGVSGRPDAADAFGTGL